MRMNPSIPSASICLQISYQPQSRAPPLLSLSAAPIQKSSHMVVLEVRSATDKSGSAGGDRAHQATEDKDKDKGQRLFGQLRSGVL